MSTTVRIPKAMATSANCIAVPIGNDFTFPNGVRLTRGEIGVFDLERCPEPGDLVLLKWPGKPPFVRECLNPPLGIQPRECWSMGVEDRDNDSIVFFDLRAAEWVGVMTGKLPNATEGAAA